MRPTTAFILGKFREELLDNGFPDATADSLVAIFWEASCTDDPRIDLVPSDGK